MTMAPPPNPLIEALWKCFTSPILFPEQGQERYYRSLCDLGYAKEAVQGHATGYRITQDGYAVAQARWGHKQR